MVLSQERRRRPLAGFHRALHLGGPGVMGVGRPRQGEEATQQPSRRHPNSEAEGREGVRDHRRLPYEEGGATDGARTSPVLDGA